MKPPGASTSARGGGSNLCLFSVEKKKRERNPLRLLPLSWAKACLSDEQKEVEVMLRELGMLRKAESL